MSINAPETLAPRAIPRQHRAVERRRWILEATRRLLEERPVEEITTALIAERAGIPIASVYCYFPNKMAVIAELTRDALATLDTRIEGLLAPRAEHGLLIAAIDAVIDAIIEDTHLAPAHRRIFQAARSNETLEPLLRVADERMMESLTRSLEAIRPDLPPLRVSAIARTVVRTFIALQDGVMSCTDDAASAALVLEWRRVIKAYLAPLAIWPELEMAAPPVRMQ